jgi:hypothetical protein
MCLSPVTVLPLYAGHPPNGTLHAMVRFSTKALLFAFVLVAAWFSTFAGYRGSMDVRASVLLVVLLTAGFAALYSRGKERAFVTGFFVVLLVNGGNLFQAPLSKYLPNFSWLNATLSPVFAPPYAPAPVVAYSAPVGNGPQTIARYMATPVTPIPATIPAQVANYHYTLAMNATIEVAWIFALGSIVGLIAMWLYSSMRREVDKA